jgi:Tfp pilus assembly PilM family ATPase
MARSCGIRIGPRRFELVVLDGSARKHRITAFKSSEFPQDAEDPAAAAIAMLREAAKTHNAPADNVALAVDTGLAAFRTLKLPFSDRDKIEEVLKFEVESQLPQWNIEDVVIDFIPMEKTGNETSLLVTAVPKTELAKSIELCSRAGLEPLEVDLEATAMVNAALAADLCHVDDSQILVHIGETSTSVVVMDGGIVRSMRAIHIGAFSHEGGAGNAEEAPAEEPREGETPPTSPSVAPEEMQRRLEHAVSRIRRELGRTVSGARTAHPLEAIYVCGIELPELVGTTVLDLPVYELDVFEEDSGQPMQGTAPLVVAYGMALRQLGGATLTTSLRREELRYTGAFERVELPLAVAALLLVTWLAVFNIFELRRVRLSSDNIDSWRRSAVNYMLGRPAEAVPGSLDEPPATLMAYIDGIRKANQKPGMKPDQNPEIDPDRNRIEQLQRMRSLLNIEIANLNKELGNTGEVTQPQSALEGLTLVLNTLAELGPDVRLSIRKADASYVFGRAPNPDTVRIVLDLSFFADSVLQATANMEQFTKNLREKPWFREVNERGSGEMTQDIGVYVDGYTVICDLSKVERKART